MSDSFVPLLPMALPSLEQMIACPHCDLLHMDVSPGPNQRVRCHRCHHVLYATRPQAFLESVLLSFPPPS